MSAISNSLDVNITNSKIENLLNYYTDELKFINNCAESLKQYILEDNIRLHKLLTESNKNTEEWELLGNYKETNDRPNNTPKTDLISSNEKYKISLKKANGSQVMSGAYNEARATILCACKDTNFKYDEYDKLLSIPWVKLRGNQKGINKQKQSGNNDLIKYIEEAERNVALVSEILNADFNNNIKFKEALLREAITGNHKFGKDSLLSANCVFVWSFVKEENKMFSINNYIEYIISNPMKLDISWKTGGSTSYQVLRIQTK